MKIEITDTGEWSELTLALEDRIFQLEQLIDRDKRDGYGVSGFERGIEDCRNVLKKLSADTSIV